jgi:serine/threonine-protein kinase HipA
LKYENEGGPSFADCFQLVRSAATKPARDLIHLFNAATFNYLIGNNDAHGKNFSLLYSTEGVQLAPLYDLVSTVCYPGLSNKMAMKIGDRYPPSELRLKDWEKHWSEIGFSQKQAHKQTLQFTDKLEALCQSPANAVEASIQVIVDSRIKKIRESLN